MNKSTKQNQVVYAFLYVFLHPLGIWKRFKWFHILQWNTGYLLLDSDVCTVLCTVRTDGRRAGPAFKNSGGGVSSWIHETTGAKAHTTQAGPTGRVMSPTSHPKVLAV